MLDTAARAGILDRRRSLIEGGGADRDRLLPVALAAGAFADGPLDRKAVGAGGVGEPAAPGQLRFQPFGRGRAADDLLELAVRKQVLKAIMLVLVDVTRAGAVVVRGRVFNFP